MYSILQTIDVPVLGFLNNLAVPLTPRSIILSNSSCNVLTASASGNKSGIR